MLPTSAEEFFQFRHVSGLGDEPPSCSPVSVSKVILASWVLHNKHFTRDVRELTVTQKKPWPSAQSYWQAQGLAR